MTTEDAPIAWGPAPTSTRKDLQLGRRAVHALNGTAVATVYALFFSHEQVAQVFGTIACLVYIFDRVRMHYPEAMQKLPTINDALFRAEEQFKESAMTPYAIALLLTMLTFPKPIALVAIYTLAIADPLSALVGITWGRRHIVPEKSVEGSAAFLAAGALIAFAVFYGWTGEASAAVVGGAIVLGFLGAVFEMLPIRIDDNLTIPLFVGFAGWIVAAFLGLAVVD